MYEVVESSPAASVGKFELPIADLNKPGLSLKVPFENVTESRLRTYVSREAKKAGYKLRVIKHSGLKLYEVARVE